MAQYYRSVPSKCCHSGTEPQALFCLAMPLESQQEDLLCDAACRLASILVALVNAFHLLALTLTHNARDCIWRCRPLHGCLSSVAQSTRSALIPLALGPLQPSTIGSFHHVPALALLGVALFHVARILPFVGYRWRILSPIGRIAQPCRSGLPMRSWPSDTHAGHLASRAKLQWVSCAVTLIMLIESYQVVRRSVSMQDPPMVVGPCSHEVSLDQCARKPFLVFPMNSGRCDLSFWVTQDTCKACCNRPRVDTDRLCGQRIGEARNPGPPKPRVRIRGKSKVHDDSMLIPNVPPVVSAISEVLNTSRYEVCIKPELCSERENPLWLQIRCAHIHSRKKYRFYSTKQAWRLAGPDRRTPLLALAAWLKAHEDKLVSETILPIKEALRHFLQAQDSGVDDLSYLCPCDSVPAFASDHARPRPET
eukprot:5019265-Amphidinium_carterae.1